MFAEKKRFFCLRKNSAFCVENKRAPKLKLGPKQRVLVCTIFPALAEEWEHTAWGCYPLLQPRSLISVSPFTTCEKVGSVFLLSEKIRTASVSRGQDPDRKFLNRGRPEERKRQERKRGERERQEPERRERAAGARASGAAARDRKEKRRKPGVSSSPSLPRCCEATA